MSPSTAADNSGGGLTKRSVVSCFIFKYDKDGRASVALFRRSGKVSTYQHCWAPIAGSVEKSDPTPLAAAWRELAEETGLTRRHLELLRQGKPYTFADFSVGREWTVNPFALRLRSASYAAGIHTDWEHEDWAWHDPMRVEDSSEFGGVPRLAESLRRVWFEKDLGPEAGAALAKGLSVLKSDYQSGAAQLAGKALRVLRDVVTLLDSDDGVNGGPLVEWWSKVRTAAWHIWKNGRESMGAAILSIMLEALRSVESTLRLVEEHHKRAAAASSPSSPTKTEQPPVLVRWRDAVLDELARLLKTRDGAQNGRAVADSFSRFLLDRYRDRLEQPRRPVSILTLSDSSTIRQSLHQATLKTELFLDVRILESRPLFEGVSLAAGLVENVLGSEAPLKRAYEQGDKTEGEGGATGADQDGPLEEGQAPVFWKRKQGSSKLHVTLFTDASAALASEGLDLVLIGADRIAASGAVSNKTGSLPAILSARHVTGGSVAVAVVSDSNKVAPPGDPREHVVEDNGAGQLLCAWAAVHNSERVRNAAGVLSKVTGSSCGGGDDAGDDPLGPGEPLDGGAGHWQETTTAAGFDGINVAVKNVSFEWVPPGLVDAYLTEMGVWSVEDIARRSEELGAEAQRLFGDL